MRIIDKGVDLVANGLLILPCLSQGLVDRRFCEHVLLDLSRVLLDLRGALNSAAKGNRHLSLSTTDHGTTCLDNVTS